MSHSKTLYVNSITIFSKLSLLMCYPASNLHEPQYELSKAISHTETHYSIFHSNVTLSLRISPTFEIPSGSVL